MTAGGVLFAAGNALHPMERSAAAHQSATWVAAHVTFGAGAVLVAAGTATLLGPLLIAVGSLRSRLLPAPVAVSLLALPVGGVLGGALPVEGWGIIPGTVVFGLGIAAAGWLSRTPA